MKMLFLFLTGNYTYQPRLLDCVFQIPFQGYLVLVKRLHSAIQKSRIQLETIRVYKPAAFFDRMGNAYQF